MKKIIVIFIIQLLANTFISATTWETVSHGFWEDESTWSGGNIPETTSSDTFLINHPIAITQDLIFESGADILIQEGGGICGHYKTTLFNNAQLITYGVLELDDLFVEGGFVGCYGGLVILASSAFLTGTGAQMIVDGAGVTIGDWFECHLPLYDFLLGNPVSTNETGISPSIEIYPNPFSDNITIENKIRELITSDEVTLIKIHDLNGREVFSTSLTMEPLNHFDLDFLTNGVYFLTITNKEKTYSKKIVKS